MAITSWNVLTAVMSTAELLKMVKSPKSVGIHDTALIRRMQSGRAVSGNIASFKLKQRQPRNLYDSGGSKSTTYSDEPGWQQDDYPGKPLYKSWKRVMSPISNIASMPMVWVTSTPSSTATTPVFFTNTGTATTTTGGIYNNAVVGGGIVNNVPVAVPYIPDHIKLDVGKERTISFPDGTNIYFKVDGSFEIEDKYSRVVYKACRVHDFNPFLNASDKLEDFIKYCGKVGVRSGDMLGIPLRSLSSGWLSKRRGLMERKRR